MTENEAKERLDTLHYKIIHTSFCNKVYVSEIESLCMAKKALEEIQQYRAIGTVEEVKNAYGKGYNQGTIDRAEEISKAREYGYNKAIDEFTEALIQRLKDCIDEFRLFEGADIFEVAEQLKAGE